jgi:hypothetical protein
MSGGALGSLASQTGRRRFESGRSLTSGPKGGGWDLEFLLLAASFALVFPGAGRFALDSYIGLWPREATEAQRIPPDHGARHMRFCGDTNIVP